MDESVVIHLKPELDEASKILLKAAEKIERDGFWKCRWDASGKGGHCAMLAIYRSTRDSRVADKAAGRLTAYLFHRNIPDVFDWNDAPERTKEDVLGALRAVALGG